MRSTLHTPIDLSLTTIITRRQDVLRRSNTLMEVEHWDPTWLNSDVYTGVSD